MLSILRRTRRLNAIAVRFTPLRAALLLPLILASSLFGSVAQAKVDAPAAGESAALLPDEAAAILSAQPTGPAVAKPDPLGQIEEPSATASSAPEAAITCNGAGGLWSAPGSWTGGFPTAADSVTITSGCTITIDTAALALSVVVQSGGLLDWDTTVGRTLTVAQSVTIDAGGTFQTPATGTVTAHILSVGTDLTNNGTLDFSTNADTAGANITFTGAGNATFGGSGATTDLRTLTINKGTSFANTLELTTTNFTVQGSVIDGTPMGFLTLTNGTFKISGSFTMASRLFAAVGYAIPATGGLWLNNPNFTVSGQAGSPTNNGLLRLSNGIFNVGNSTGNSMGGGAGSFFTIEGGTMNVAGRLNSASANITYRQSGGIINVNTVGNTAATPSFGFTAATTFSFFSGGTINLVQANTNVAPLDYNQAGTMIFSGGTLNIGTGATATNFVFRVQGQMPNVFVDNTTNNKTANLSGQANFWGNLTINPGATVNVNPGTAQTLVMIGPSLINNGAIVTGTTNTGTVNFAGGLQQVGAPYAQTYVGTGTVGTAVVRVGSFSVQSPLGVTLDPAVSNLNIYRINDFYGPITNAGKLAVGNADAVLSVIQRGVGNNPFPAGTLDVSPTFSIGAGGLNLIYTQSTSLITTGPEIPVSRTVLGISISNPGGVTLTGGALTATNTAAALTLGGGTLNTTAANLLTLSATTTGALSGGSGLTYVNGPLARTLPASLAAAATYTFPIGKGTFKMLELVNPTTTAAGTLVVQAEVFDANSGGTAGIGFSALNTNRYWAVSSSGAGALTNTTVRLTEQGTVAVNAIGQSATQAGAYDSIGGAVVAPVIGPSSTVTTLGFFAVGTLTGSVTMCGNFDVGAATSPPNFLTLTAAVAALNSRMMTCAVTFTLLDATYPSETYPIVIQPNGGASSTNTLTIKPGVGVNAAFTGTSASALLTLNGADWVTIDGSNTVGGTTRNLTFQNTNVSVTSAVLWGQSIGTNDPATNNTIKNVNVSGNTSITTLIGIGFGSSTIGANSLGNRNDSNRIQNNAVTATQFGIYSQGATTLIKNVGTVVTGNTLGGAGALAISRAGIFVGFDDGTQVTNNTVNGIGPASTGGFVDAFGIALGSSGVSNTGFGTNNDVANVVVTGNIIGPVTRQDTSAAVGISMGTNNYGTSLIANNSVWGALANGTSGDFAAGIYVGNAGSAYATTLVYYNSVSMVGNRDTGGASSQPAFALAILGANPKVDLRNNALYNISTAGTGGPGGNAGSYAIGVSSLTPYSNLTSNYNDYFTSGTASHFGMLGSFLTNVLLDQPTLAAWQAALGKDANSISADPTFSSPSNLQPSPGTPLVGAGTPVAVTVDILGITHSGGTPTIGAYEQAADVAGPVLTYTAFGNTTSTANRVLAITATDFTGVPTAGIGFPVVYLRKGVVGAYSASQCVFVSGSSYDCTTNYGAVGGVTTGDTIQYYIVPQDTIDNVSANPAAGAGAFTTNPPAAGTPPTVPNSYLISAALSGTKTLCASGCDYATLTGAGGLFAAINAGVATGNIVIEIGSDLVAGEDGSVGLNALAEEPPASNYTVKMYPVGAARLITSTAAPTGGFIRLNGADRVTIDGSIGGTGTDRSLTITDTNTGAASAAIWLQSNGADGATNNTVKNVNIVGTTTTATAATLFGVGAGSSTISVASFGTGNINNTYENNAITKTQIGIYSGGQNAGNKNTGTVITQNVMNAASPNNVTTGGILVNFENGVQITQNDIGNLLKHDGTAGTTGTVFGIALGTVPSNTVTTFTGNEVINASVTRNKIDALTQLHATGFSAFGIVVASATSGTTLVANNMISQVRAASTASDFSAGIVAGGGTGSTSQIYANSVSMTGGRNAASFPSYGLAIGANNPIVDVKDNIFLNTQTSSSTGKMYAIATASTSFTNLTSSHNDLFVPAGAAFFVGQTGGLGTAGTDQATLTAWQTATGQDTLGSLSADPLFTSASDLHLLGTSPAAGLGTPLAAVTVDFDNDPRDPTTPDIGADEIRYADLSLTKDDGSLTEVAGTSVTYTIVASNAGPYAASVIVTDNFPAALTGCSTTCVASVGSTCTAVAILGVLSDTASLASGGTATYTAICNIAPDATGTLANTAGGAITPGSVFDSSAGNDSPTDSDTLSSEADVSITKDDGVLTAIPGGTVTYTIVASNAGPSDAPGTNVTDNFPVALSCSTTCVASAGSTCTAGPILTSINDTVNLLAGGSATYTAVCSISAGATGPLANTATVTGGVTDPGPGVNSATDTDSLTPTADLSITKDDGVTNAVPGGTVTYTIMASNAGPSDAPGTNVTDNFPASLSCSTTCVASVGSSCTAGPILTSINDTVSLLANGIATYTAVCSVAGNATGSLVNTATVTAAGGITDPGPGLNSATDTDTLAPEADLSITKTDGVTVVQPGTNTTYTIVASNAGPSSAPTAAVIDVFPAACTSANWTCSGAGGGTCAASGSGNINQSVNLPSGGSVTFIAVCSVSISFTGTLSNTATIGVGVNDPNTANNSATDVDTVTNEIFSDGFESGGTSQWSQTVPFTFEAYATVGVADGSTEAAFDYDFAAVQSGERLAPTSIAVATDAMGKALFFIEVRRSDVNGPLELALSVVGGVSSSWVTAGEVGQQVRIEWSGADQNNVGHVAVWLDGRLALWVEGYDGNAAPAAVTLLRAPAALPPTAPAVPTE